MSFSSLLSHYANQKLNPVEEKTTEEPETYDILSLIYPKIMSIRLNSQPNENGEKNLGLLFIIIDEMPFEHLWRLWISESDCNVSIYIHAKYPERVSSQWVKENLVTEFHYTPIWGSLDIAKVMIYMLLEATNKSPHINKFIFASESCIPIQTFQKTIDSIYQPIQSDYWSDIDLKSSWLHYHDRSKCNGYSVGPQFDQMEKTIPPEHVYKADQWAVISRFHALQILAMKSAYDTAYLNNAKRAAGFTFLFKLARASDELVLACSLSMLGYLGTEAHNDYRSQVVNRRITYCDWSANEKRPQHFTATNRELIPETHLQDARKEGCCIFRKVSIPDNNLTEEIVRMWVSIVYTGNDSLATYEKMFLFKKTMEDFKNNDAFSVPIDLIADSRDRIFNYFENRPGMNYSNAKKEVARQKQAFVDEGDKLKNRFRFSSTSASNQVSLVDQVMANLPSSTTDNGRRDNHFNRGGHRQHNHGNSNSNSYRHNNNNRSYNHNNNYYSSPNSGYNNNRYDNKFNKYGGQDVDHSPRKQDHSDKPSSESPHQSPHQLKRKYDDNTSSSSNNKSVKWNSDAPSSSNKFD